STVVHPSTHKKVSLFLQIIKKRLHLTTSLIITRLVQASGTKLTLFTISPPLTRYHRVTHCLPVDGQRLGIQYPLSGVPLQEVTITRGGFSAKHSPTQGRGFAILSVHFATAFPYCHLSVIL